MVAAGNFIYNRLPIFIVINIFVGCNTKLIPHIREGRIESSGLQGKVCEHETTAENKGKGRDETIMSETKNPQYVELMKWMPAHLFRPKKISVRDANLYVQPLWCRRYYI